LQSEQLQISLDRRTKNLVVNRGSSSSELDVCIKYLDVNQGRASFQFAGNYVLRAPCYTFYSPAFKSAALTYWLNLLFQAWHREHLCGAGYKGPSL